MAEPYAGYFASDLVYGSAMCAQMYEIVGPVADNHFHPLSTPSGILGDMFPGAAVFPGLTIYPEV